MEMPYNPPAPQGWQCPICKRVYSPTTSMCWYCGGDQKVSISTSSKNSNELRFCTLKGKLCTNANINGFCMLSACNRLEYNPLDDPNRGVGNGC